MSAYSSTCVDPEERKLIFCGQARCSLFKLESERRFRLNLVKVKWERLGYLLAAVHFFNSSF